MLFLGVDAGGTKTDALLVDERGAARGGGQAGPGNWEVVGPEGAFQALQQAVGQALAEAGVEAGAVTAAAYGLAGLDWPGDELLLRPLVERLGVGGPQVLVNDSFVALRAGARQPWGVVVVAGTGTTAAGRNRRGETARTLGLGYPFDDWGSAPDLAQAAVHAVARAYTGRGPVTALGERLVALAGAASVAELLEKMSRWQIDLRPAVTAVVQAIFEQAAAGDEAAAGIVRRAGRALGGGAAAVIRRLGMEGETFDVVLAGGLFAARDTLLLGVLAETVQAIASRAELRPLEEPPVRGAALLAMEARKM